MAVTVEELQSFTQFVSERMYGDSDLSLEACPALWRVEQERAETIAAIRRGESDIEAGRFRALAEFDPVFHKKFGLPPRTEYQTGGNHVCR